MQECLRRLDYVRMNLKRRKISEKEKVMYVAGGVGEKSGLLESHFVRIVGSEDACVRKLFVEPITTVSSNELNN